ncbi:MAG: radical SAM protein [Lachnospiraceae bacterium]|nr:radical SAM protein [Lachnospiraceae bacterium]
MLCYGNDANECSLCPRACRVNRKSGEKGFCGMGAKAVVSRAHLHMWEEPCISGKNGSGTVFFCGCNLQCVFCQNRTISDPADHHETDLDLWRKRQDASDIYKTADQPGTYMTGNDPICDNSKDDQTAWITVETDELADIFLRLQGKGAENINLVTPTQFAGRIAEAIGLARNEGLQLPIVYNCGGYESVDTLKMLEDYVDVWMPDFKYYSDELSIRYSKAAHYFETASAALREMVRQTGGKHIFDENGLMKRGVLVRHLVLPGQTADSKRILRFLHENFGDAVYISIMNQFTPVGDLNDYPEINRKLEAGEYRRVVGFAEKIGITKGFVQEGDTAAESFIPAFDGTGII